MNLDKMNNSAVTTNSMNGHMRHLLAITALTLSFHASNVLAIPFPSQTEVVKAVITCRAAAAPNKSLGVAIVTLDRESSVELLSFLESINDHWTWWGFITPPAGDIQITFWLSNHQSFLVQTWGGLRKVGTDAGYRVLSQEESKAFNMRMPTCARELKERTMQ